MFLAFQLQQLYLPLFVNFAKPPVTVANLVAIILASLIVLCWYGATNGGTSETLLAAAPALSQSWTRPIGFSQLKSGKEGKKDKEKVKIFHFFRIFNVFSNLQSEHNLSMCLRLEWLYICPTRRNRCVVWFIPVWLSDFCVYIKVSQARSASIFGLVNPVANYDCHIYIDHVGNANAALFHN